jgi:hypothetical protein
MARDEVVVVVYAQVHYDNQQACSVMGDMTYGTGAVSMVWGLTGSGRRMCCMLKDVVDVVGVVDCWICGG